MPDPKPAPPTKAKEVASGFSTLQDLVKKSGEDTPPPPKEAPPPPPAIDTGSVGGLIKSFRDRVGYAFFGPPKKDDPPPVKKD